MVDIVLRAEQVRSAPREVRDWIGALLVAELSLEGQGHEQHGLEEESLPALSADEAVQMFERMRDDYLACQVFLELGRDSRQVDGAYAPLRRIAIGDIVLHARLRDADQLMDCLTKINETFSAVRGEPAAALLAFDWAGGLYVHDTTRQSVKALWQALVRAQIGALPEVSGLTMPMGPTVPVNSRPMG